MFYSKAYWLIYFEYFILVFRQYFNLTIENLSFAGLQIINEFSWIDEEININNLASFALIKMNLNSDALSVSNKFISPAEIKYNRRKNFFGYLSLFGGVWIQLFVGSQYIWGNIKSYVTSYFRQYEPSLDLSTTFILFPVMVITTTCLMPVGGYFARRYNPKLWAGAGASIALISILIATFSHRFWIFLIFYGIGYGIGSSVMYIVPVIWGWEYFPDHKGIVNGIVIGGFGFGSFVFNLISTALINPDNIESEEGYFPKEVYERVPSSLRIILIWWTVLVLIAVCTLSKPNRYIEDSTEDRETMQTGSSKIQKQSIDNQTSDGESSWKVELTLKECLKTSQFYLLFAMMYLSVFYGYFIANNYKDFGDDHINDDHFLSIIGAASSACAGFRFTWAFLMQKYSFKFVYSIMLVLQIIVAMTLNWSVKNKYSYLISIWLTIWIEGGHFTILPTVLGKIYGSIGSTVFTVVFFTFGVSWLSGVLVSKVLLHQVIEYFGLFIICSVMTLISLIILLVFFKDEQMFKNYNNQEDEDSTYLYLIIKNKSWYWNQTYHLLAYLLNKILK